VRAAPFVVAMSRSRSRPAKVLLVSALGRAACSERSADARFGTSPTLTRRTRRRRGLAGRAEASRRNAAIADSLR